jgi:hypothetical protein
LVIIGNLVLILFDSVVPATSSWSDWNFLIFIVVIVIFIIGIVFVLIDVLFGYSASKTPF